jgi:hypothetical protein
MAPEPALALREWDREPWVVTSTQAAIENHVAYLSIAKKRSKIETWGFCCNLLLKLIHWSQIHEYALGTFKWMANQFGIKIWSKRLIFVATTNNYIQIVLQKCLANPRIEPSTFSLCENLLKCDKIQWKSKVWVWSLQVGRHIWRDINILFLWTSCVIGFKFVSPILIDILCSF